LFDRITKYVATRNPELTLFRSDLVDEIYLSFFPVVLGKGK
jgi:hypothetical protein